ncbi:hypothetical protein K431DRAFT_287613 [Polychaeton citri CBS 116435]|uniref:Stress-response A/B barrel domain-containing protein n=1 Tax=Polychaeton citri CBS 116435 TaxID=1314669 RepID=A0A9P4Q0Q8_9PEZI|nr:hypothetical protein K431DRAFT_287613 [Polychaeton citri CBS 116435]
MSNLQKVCKRMLALKDRCLHPTTKQLYLKSYGGGRDNSPEGHQVGAFSHGFVSEFQSAEDREYYLNKDPIHLEFVASLEGLLQNVRVVDFEPGKF